MPRVAVQNQYLRYRQLRKLWTTNQRRFGLLSPAEQWELHDYYRPSQQLTRLELAVHRAEMATAQPSLPSRAGKAWALLDSYRTGKVALPKAKPGQITVRTVVKPEIAVKRLAQVLLELARNGDIRP